MDTTILETDELAARVRADIESEQRNRDEVWDGVYVVSPNPNDEHNDVEMNLGTILNVVFGWSGFGWVRSGPNVSDRDERWEHNYRCPDLAVYLKGTTARNLGTHWVGGPDFAVEVISRYDRSRKKFDLCSKVGFREWCPWNAEPGQDVPSPSLERASLAVATNVSRVRPNRPAAASVEKSAIRRSSSAARPSWNSPNCQTTISSV